MLTRKLLNRDPGAAAPPVRPKSDMKLLVVSDIESKFIWEHFDPALFRDVKLIISCGDLKASYLSYLVTMIPAPLFYVHGNHDGSYERNPPQGCECIDGRVVEFGGLRIAGLGGCMGSDPTNPLQFSEAQMEKRMKKLNGEMKHGKPLDIFVSHAPAKGIGDKDGFHEGFQCFNTLHQEHQTRLHLFGHIHAVSAPTSKSDVYESGSTRLINCAGYRLIDLRDYMV